MRWRRLRAPFPLLGKELVEQSARRRTYIVRAVYAVLLFAVFLIVVHREFQPPQYIRARVSAVAQLGRGRGMFEALVWLQFGGIVLFLPAMMAGALTSEKERGSMPLLLLTELRPWEILLQKYLGRLVPMFAFLLLSLPLLAACYAFGGITTDYLLSGIYCLLLLCLQIGALALVCSAFCRTSLGAFLAAYAACLLYGMVMPALAAPVVAGVRIIWRAWTPIDLFDGAQGARFGEVVLGSWRILVLTGVCLIAARLCLLRRALLEPRPVLVNVFRWIDRLFAAVNRRLGDIEVFPERESLPGDEPVAWRETAKRSLGKLRYLFRAFVAIELPVLAICVLGVMWRPDWQGGTALEVLLIVLWALAALAVTGLSANAVPAERGRETLDLLLATPMAGRDVVRQKLRGVRRLIVVLAIPLGTVYLTRWWWKDMMLLLYGRPPRYSGSFLGPPESLTGWLYLLSSGLAVAVYLPLLSWVALWAGVRCRTRLRATAEAFVVLIAWVLIPWLAGALVLTVRVGPSQAIGYLLLASPATLPAAMELPIFLELFRGQTLRPIMVDYLGYGVLLLVVRWGCLRSADRWLGRATPRGNEAPAPEAVAPSRRPRILPERETGWLEGNDG